MLRVHYQFHQLMTIKYFTDKFWGALDLRYQYGGELKVDGVKQDNQINALGGGATVGYQIIPPLGINVSYGNVFNTPSNVEVDMFKVTLVFSYVNIKKNQSKK